MDDDFSLAGIEPYGVDAEAAAPIDGAGPRLARLHAAGTGCTHPRDLLVPASRAPELVGRADELAALEHWLSESAAVSVRGLTGRAGSGKTRLAIELCERAEALGWSAGFASPQALRGLAAEAGRSRFPVLVVIDRAGTGETLPHDYCVLLGQPRHPKLRLLLLERDTGCDGWWADLGRTGVAMDPAEPVRLAGLRSADERAGLLGTAMAWAARLSGLPICPPPPGVALDTSEPLHLLMAALVAPHQGVAAVLAQSPAGLAQVLAERDMLRLEQCAWRLHLEPLLLTHVAACITLQRGSAANEAAGLIAEETYSLGLHLPGTPEQVADCVADVLLAADGETFEPLGPDLLGEAFVIRALIRHAPEVQAGIIERALRRDRPAVLGTLRRAVQDHAGDDPAHPALAWMHQAAA